MKGKEIELTITQCADLFDLPGTLEKAKVKVDWLTSVDIAVNKEAVKGIVEGYRSSIEPSQKVKEYQSAVNKAKSTLKGQELEEEFRRLNRKFVKYLEEEEERIETIRKEAQNEVRKVKIIPIKVSSVKGESEVMSLIASALLPVLDFETESEGKDD